MRRRPERIADALVSCRAVIDVRIDGAGDVRVSVSTVEDAAPLAEPQEEEPEETIEVDA